MAVTTSTLVVDVGALIGVPVDQAWIKVHTTAVPDLVAFPDDPQIRVPHKVAVGKDELGHKELTLPNTDQPTVNLEGSFQWKIRIEYMINGTKDQTPWIYVSMPAGTASYNLSDFLDTAYQPVDWRDEFRDQMLDLKSQVASEADRSASEADRAEGAAVTASSISLGAAEAAIVAQAPNAATPIGGALSAAIDKGLPPVSAALFGLATGASAATNTAAILAALATGRPVYIPGNSATVYNVNDLSAGFTSGSALIGDGATLRLASGAYILIKTGINGFRLDGLNFDANDIGQHAVRFTDCTDFDLGNTGYHKATTAGLDLQDCHRFKAGTLTVNNNGTSGGTVGSGVYVRAKSGGTGCQDWRIGTVIGADNGLGATLDGQTFHTTGSNCTGSVGGIVAKNNTRYGAKFQHTGGMVQVGSISADGCAIGFSCPAVNGLDVGQIVATNSSGIGIWLDAACENVTIANAVARNSGQQGFQIVAGAEDVSIGNLLVDKAGTVSTGTAGRGLDIRGVTRGKFGNVTIRDCGSDNTNTTTEALYVLGSAVVDLQFGNVTLQDTRSGTAACAAPANFTGATAASGIVVSSLNAVGFRADAMNNQAAIRFGKVSSGGKTMTARGTATISSGTAAVAVTHGLLGAPVHVQLAGAHAETSQAVVSGLFAATFNVAVPSNVTADRVIYWTATVSTL